MTEEHDDFAFEPVPGLPDTLPQGEKMLWQGSPDWRLLAVQGFHVRKIGAYFALLLAWQVGAAWQDGASLGEIALLSGGIVVLAAAGVGILCGLAYFYARGTIYTLTSKRIVIRSGLALPVTLNLPLALIDTASVGSRTDQMGSIALAVAKPNRIAWLVLWPNVRPWSFSNPQPLLRCLPNVDAVASTLAAALAGNGAALRPLASTRGASVHQGDAMPAGATLAA